MKSIPVAWIRNVLYPFYSSNVILQILYCDGCWGNTEIIEHEENGRVLLFFSAITKLISDVDMTKLQSKKSSQMLLRKFTSKIMNRNFDAKYTS